VNVASLPGLAVLNPGGRDPSQSYEQGVGKLTGSEHPPVNYHGYAACTAGAFYREPKLAARHRSVLLLLRADFKQAKNAFRVLKAHGCFVGISFKESGTHQVAKQLAHPGRLARFRELAANADLCLASTPELAPLYASASRQVVQIPTPYPIDLEGWDFSLPPSERHGIFIGTREFDVPSRNHLLALAAVRTLSENITVIGSGPRTLRLIKALGFPPDQLNVFPRLEYPDYLRLMARHRIVLQFDQSFVPGQVAGDAAMCGIPTIGGNGAIERLICPWLHGHGRTFSELIQLARQILHDNPFYEQQIVTMRKAALESISFASVREQLARRFPGATRSPG
jgi:hypothetical protein